MAGGNHFEIERKLLIRFPDTASLAAQPKCAVWRIAQTYLVSEEPGLTRRVRRIEENGRISCYRTFKRRLTALRCIEDEAEITPEEYERYLKEADPESRTIEKTRYRIPFEGHTLEIDVYPFWSDRAILEVELEAETEKAALPDYIEIIRDVTADPAYKNWALAKHIPTEEI